jgi:drug/metabolite transporter (DMT)-like permease
MSPVRSCLFAAILFAAATPLAKILLAHIEPFALAGLLYLGASAAVAPAAYRAGLPISSRRDLMRLGIVVVAGGIAAPALLMLALQRTPAATIALWLNVEVVATTLLAWGFFREDLDHWGGTGVAIITAAGVLLAFPYRTVDLDAALLVSAACLCWALDNNCTSIIDSLTPTQITLVKGLIGGATNLALGGAMESRSISREATLGGLGLGALSYGVSLVFYIRGAQQLGAARSQVIFASAPFIGCALSWLMLGDAISSEQIIAGGIMLGGVALMFARHLHEHEHTAMMHIHYHSHRELHHAHTDPLTIEAHTDLHSHPAMHHAHPHRPDLHHRHTHQDKPRES